MEGHPSLLQPFRLAVVFVLTWGTAAHADTPAAPHVLRERSVTVASLPSGQPPVINVAEGSPTLFLLSSPIQRKSRSLVQEEHLITVAPVDPPHVLIAGQLQHHDPSTTSQGKLHTRQAPGLGRH
ncbi:DUF2381 family protein [Myxococcus sp. CA040A]|uniref:DUF2381 family protein n=1 Tax=Myxococcus sp. CA040A TaxID=2741738 RepID=UPI00352CEF50